LTCRFLLCLAPVLLGVAVGLACWSAGAQLVTARSDAAALAGLAVALGGVAVFAVGLEWTLRLFRGRPARVAVEDRAGAAK
jgi:hypothetical protein